MTVLRHRVLNSSNQPVVGKTATVALYDGNQYATSENYLSRVNQPVSATSDAQGWLQWQLPENGLGRRASYVVMGIEAAPVFVAVPRGLSTVTVDECRVKASSNPFNPISEEEAAARGYLTLAAARSAVATAVHPLFGTSVPVTITGLNNGQSLAVNSQANGQSTRTPVQAAIDCTDLRLVFPMWSNGSSGAGETAPSGVVTFKAAIEYNGVTYPVTFQGRRTVAADPWSLLISDPLGVELAAGDNFFVRTFFNTPASGTYPMAINLNGTVGLSLTGGSWVNGSDACDATGAMSSASAGTAWGTFGPSEILGTPTGARKPTALFLGDSIMQGIGDQETGGFAFRALAGNPIPAHTVGMPGGQLTQLVAKGGHARVSPFLTLGEHPFSMFGTNDLGNGRTEQQLEQDFLTLGKMLINRGVRNKLTIGTLIPRTNSGNTTTNANNARRVAFNTWVRAGCPMDPVTGLRVDVGTSGAILAGHALHPIKGYVEVADVIESARDSGLFKTGMTTDGTHPNAAGAIAAKVPVQAWLAGLTTV